MKASKTSENYDGFGAYEIRDSWILPSERTLAPNLNRHLDPKTVNDGPITVNLLPDWYAR